MGLKKEQFLRKVDENLFCSICCDIFDDPVSCKDGHTFCKECIHNWLKIDRKCPLDNGYLTNIYLFPQFTVKGIIDNLEVYCHPQDTPREVRCDWVGKLQNLSHHKKTCPFQEVKCSHEKCNQTIPKIQLEDHEKICDFRQVECEKCEMVLLQNEKEKHIKDDCLMALIRCPNRCRDKQYKIIEIKRFELDLHLSKVCPKTLVDCPYKEQGCGVKVERQNANKHVQKSIAGHMMLLAKECSLLRKQNTSLTEQCASLSLTCSSLAETNSELKNEFKQIKEEFHAQLLSSSSYTWTVRDYTNLSKKYSNGSCIPCPPFWIRGYRLRFQLYPNGKTAIVKGFLSLYLKKVEDDSTELSDTMPDASSDESAIPFRLTVISQQPDTEDVSFQDKHVFTKKSNTWGWHKFMKASDALLPSYCKNGSLMIQCTIQPDKTQ